MKYPKVHPDKWKSTKLTVKERGEIDYLRNTANLSVIYLAKKYSVNECTIRCWSNPAYRRYYYEKGRVKLAKKLENPEYRKKTNERKRELNGIRYQNDPMYRGWIKSKKQRKPFARPTKEIERERGEKYYYNNILLVRARNIRHYRKKDLNGFRLFMNRVERS